MSSTDDSNGRREPRPQRISPRRYTKRIGYGATSSARKKSHSPRDARTKPGSSRDAAGDIEVGPGGGHSRLKFTPGGGTCDSDSDCCGDCCGGGDRRSHRRSDRRRKPVRRGCVVFIVFLALLLDSLLLTCMVPIIPNYLRESANDERSQHANTTSFVPILDTFLTTTEPWYPVTSLTSANSQQVAVNEQPDGNTGLQEPLQSPPRTNGTYTKENTKISLLFASKTLVQVLTNLIVGPLTERIGYTMPMFTGFVVLLLSTIAFAYGNTYELLLAARAFQGVGTAFSTTSGMGLLASLYPNQNERAVAQTKAFSGLALGVLLGPPYGGILYQYFGGKETPCMILAATALFEGALQLCVMRPRVERQGKRGASLLKLLMDPYILVTAAAITISNLTTAVLEPALPIWMYYTMDAATWLQAHVCTCMLPNIGALVDHRHQPVYGSAYAITDNAFGLAFAVGPAISGPLIDTIGFPWTLRGVSLIILLFVPFVLLLKNPPGKNLQQDEETNLVETTESSPEREEISSYKATTTTDQ
ncbi:synaptic vesicular amine transporter [Elysia marginata]|uniref:Synaptic vesicular amine transporter n=1 Tax=Elysia marginata TaxID=1093978 RepID=A0AAV4F9G2_9GAST|nr:synaptic vesicular amine transporter [Elysia marginata]